MNITLIESTQAIIEFSLAAAMIVSALLIVFSPLKNKGFKYFIVMFFVMATILFAEGFAYICRGNLQPINIFATRLTNFIVFFLNFFIMAIFIRYIYAILEEKNVKVRVHYKRLVDLTCIIGFLILFINIFTKWMYYFDSDNYYKRNYMWYAYSFCALAFPIITTVLCVRHKKEMPKQYFFSFLLFVWFPVISLFVQVLIVGYSILAAGMSLDLFFILVLHLLQLRKERISDDELEAKRAKGIQSALLFSVVLIAFSTAIVSCITSITRTAKSSIRGEGETISSVISDSINVKLLEPISVAKTLSNENNLKVLLKNNDPNAINTQMKNYLSSIEDGFGYHMVYATSSINNGYYTSNGLSRIANINNEADEWYYKFLDTNKDFELYIDKDESFDNELAVFVNVKVYDEAHSLVGVCGVGININEISDILGYYEKKYDVKVNLTRENGRIIVNSTLEGILDNYVDEELLKDIESDSFKFTTINKKNIYSSYLNSLDWYIVVESETTLNQMLFELIIPSIIVYVIGLFIMGLFFAMTYIEDKRSFEAIIERHNAATHDEMTGLLNRSAYERDLLKYKERDLNNYAILQLDINGLKTTNDTLGHQAGDELIVGTAHSVRNAFSNNGKCYRVGGDEFLVFAKANKDTVEDNLKTFRHLTKNFNGNLIKEIKVSVGIVYCSENIDLTLEEMIKLADSRMYEEKERYYKENGIEKRRT